MVYNLFIAYDLMRPGQNYEAVRDRIKSLGQWHQCVCTPVCKVAAPQRSGR